MLRRLSAVLSVPARPRANVVAIGSAAPTAPFSAAASESSSSVVKGSGLQRQAFDVIAAAGGQPLHNKEVFKQLEAALPEGSPLRARLTLTHLKTKILKPLAEHSYIKSVAVREEGKKRASFGFVVGKLPPWLKAQDRAAAGIAPKQQQAKA